MPKKTAPDDLERVKLLKIVSKRGFKDLSLEQIKRLLILVEKKDYSHDKKARKSKMKLLAQINSRIYELEEGKGIFS
jgi:DNA-binding transcriptional MerR regulator